MTEQLPGSPTCPRCGALQDAARPVDGSDAIPTHGSVTVCIYCLSIGQYVRGPFGYSIAPLSAHEEEAFREEHSEELLSVRQISAQWKAQSPPRSSKRPK